MLDKNMPIAKVINLFYKIDYKIVSNNHKIELTYCDQNYSCNYEELHFFFQLLKSLKKWKKDFDYRLCILLNWLERRPSQKLTGDGHHQNIKLKRLYRFRVSIFPDFLVCSHCIIVLQVVFFLYSKSNNF